MIEHPWSPLPAGETLQDQAERLMGRIDVMEPRAACKPERLLLRDAAFMIARLMSALAASEARRQQLRGLLKMAACEHGNQAGGNDYMVCNDCGLMWDWRKQQPQDVLQMLIAAECSNETIRGRCSVDGDMPVDQ